MKIKNVSNQDLKIPMKKTNGQKTIVTLAPGQIVYSEAEKKHENKQLVIWERKQLIEITNCPLPQKAEYCHPYNTIKLGTPVVPVVTFEYGADDSESDDDSTEEAMDVSMITPISEDDDVFEDDIDLTAVANADVVNKGGRPKGSKNKTKKKTKKKAKRPYNRKPKPGADNN